MKQNFLERTKGGLIVSCQALEDEPLHSAYIMSRMAYAAMLGGAVGIRANTVEDITEIRKVMDLPIIGIIKKVYGECDVYITPTMAEVDALVQIGVEVIAIDATARPRPDGRSLEETFAEVRAKYPHQLFMADCASYEECDVANRVGFDIIGTTMCGYTPATKGTPLPNFNLLRQLGETMHKPVIAEGGVWSPEALAKVMEVPGVHAAVVGSAITRPMLITRRYVDAIEKCGR